MPDFLIPIALVLAAFLLAPRHWLAGKGERPFATRLLMAAGTIVIARYFWWRITETLPLGGVGFSEAVFCWTLFAIETAVWIDTFILFALLANKRDNSPAADASEIRLRATPDGELPTVDIFIATYNEDLDILEKTIVGALALEWPHDRRRIHVLDDSKRDWLKTYCAEKGVGYLTRNGNAHAKAGNINAAIARTDGDFFLVLDADFVPQKNFLYRAMGLFDDPVVGIVQIPHSFYNADPMQTNLQMRRKMPDDQRLFFDVIMAGRDGWNAAFCCGSNSITRRSAIEAIGGGLPTGSITEDILLTLALKRKGYTTRYLNEKLAIGLAPESLSALYIQRARWARGAIQMLFLKDGPFGPGLRLRDRILFLPNHWLLQPLMVLVTLTTPAICLWTGWSPLPTASVEDVLGYQIPALMTTLLTLRLLAPNGFFPLAATVNTAMQIPRILPTIITTLIKPHGHAFRVTPKGGAANGGALDRTMIWAPVALILATALGLYINGDINNRILRDSSQIPMIAFWACVSMVILTVIQVVAVAKPSDSTEEWFPYLGNCRIVNRDGSVLETKIRALSLGAVRVPANTGIPVSGWILIDLPEVGPVAGFARGQDGDDIEIALDVPAGAQRDTLLRMLFTRGLDNTTRTQDDAGITFAMLRRTLGTRKQKVRLAQPSDTKPAWLVEYLDHMAILTRCRSLNRDVTCSGWIEC